MIYGNEHTLMQGENIMSNKLMQLMAWAWNSWGGG